MEREVWQAAVHKVTKSQTRLSDSTATIQSYFIELSRFFDSSEKVPVRGFGKVIQDNFTNMLLVMQQEFENCTCQTLLQGTENVM